MDRNCDKCIHHTSGTCSSWDCKMQTVEDVKRETREKAIEEFKEAVKHRCYMSNVQCEMNYVMPWEIDEIANKLKGEQYHANRD